MIYRNNQETVGRFLFGDNYEQMQMDLLKAYIEALDEYIKEFKERIIAEIEKQEANK